MSIEVAYEYDKDDEGWVMIQTLDKNSAEFYKDLDEQLQAIQNPFVEPVFLIQKLKALSGYLVRRFYLIRYCLFIPG